MLCEKEEKHLFVLLPFNDDADIEIPLRIYLSNQPNKRNQREKKLFYRHEGKSERARDKWMNGMLINGNANNKFHGKRQNIRTKKGWWKYNEKRKKEYSSTQTINGLNEKYRETTTTPATPATPS